LCADSQPAADAARSGAPSQAGPRCARRGAASFQARARRATSSRPSERISVELGNPLRPPPCARTQVHSRSVKHPLDSLHARSARPPTHPGTALGPQRALLAPGACSLARARAQCQPPAPAQRGGPGPRLAPRAARLQSSQVRAAALCRERWRALSLAGSRRAPCRCPAARARAAARPAARACWRVPAANPAARARATRPSRNPCRTRRRSRAQLSAWRIVRTAGTLPGSRAAAPCVQPNDGMPVRRGHGRPPCRSRAHALLPSLARASPVRDVPLACRGSRTASAALLAAPAVRCARWPHRRPPPRMPQVPAATAAARQELPPAV